MLVEYLSGLLQSAPCGPVESKLNPFGEILHEECSNRCGKETIREPAAGANGRREKGINDPVVDRRQCKRWRKAEEVEKEGLNVFLDDVKKQRGGVIKYADLVAECRESR